MAALTTTAAVVSAGAATYGAYRSHESAKAGLSEQQKIKNLRRQQAGDILKQLDAEELIYEDELDMIKKQTALAESKLDLQTGQQVEGLGEEVGNALNQLVGKSRYGGGASERAKVDVEAKYEETMGDLKESYDMSMEEITLRDDEAERAAFLRHEEIVGSLEAQRQQLLDSL